MPSSISRLTATDHDRLLRLIRRACAPGPSQERWRAELTHLMRAHQAAETETLDSATVGGAGDGALAAFEELHRVDAGLLDALDRLESIELGAAGIEAAGAALAEELGRHAELLADRVLAPMTAALPRKLMRELGGRYAEVRDGALREEGADEPPPRRLDVSRAELYELAKRAGIEGRSSMSRRDLINELQRLQRQEPLQS
jgi:hypothetical protein